MNSKNNNETIYRTEYCSLIKKKYVLIYHGGERGIRTLETVTCLHAFQACAFSHSATSP